MRIDVQTNNVEISQEGIESLKTKITGLEKYYENIMDTIVYLHDETDKKVVEIKINVKDNQLFIKEKAETLTAAIDIAIDVCKKQIKRHKEKL